MTIHKDKLAVAISIINNDTFGTYMSGKFENLASDIFFEKELGDISLKQILSYLNFIQQDLWNLQEICLRLDWQKQLFSKNELNIGWWMGFARLDIEHFHFEFRSIFDYIAKIFRQVSDIPGETKERSFEKLRNWVTKEKNAKKIGGDIATSVLSVNWFDEVKALRELITHFGGEALTFPEKGRILFQVTRGWKDYVSIPEIMYNENVADFELYAGMYIGYLFAYLENISTLVRSRLNIIERNTDSRSYHPGLGVIKEWISKVGVVSKNRFIKR